MAEHSKANCEGASDGCPGTGMTDLELSQWFIREVFPLEASLMQFLHRNWRNESDLNDLRQDVYVRLYESARNELPDPVKPFLFAVARNLIVDRIRKTQVVPIDAVSDIDTLDVASESSSPERNVIARDELRRLQSAIDRLPPRCREAVILARIECLSGREIATRLGIHEPAVSRLLERGVRSLAEMLYGQPPDPRAK
jgi:RNA polymerase sigma factor (sigma-70 family)